jgi:hypothetical protein
VRVDPPVAQFRTYQPGQFLRVSVPANWNQIGEQGSVTYAPEGGFFRGDNNTTAFTHGVQIGTIQGGTGNLQQDTDKLLEGFAQSNPELRRQGNYRRESISGRNALTAQLSNVSEVTRARETILVSTTKLRDNSVFFVVGVSPENEAATYREAFRKVLSSIQLNDR